MSELRGTGGDTALSGRHRWTHLSACQHGPGSPSTSSVLMLHELIQLEHQAWCCEVTAIRIGTWRRIGPGRLDGTLWSSSREEKLQRLKRAYKASVRNTEMESTVFVAECRFCGLKDFL
uniref:uridine phosphorylase 2 isoform X2 n=1 Tax=Nyctereutes procyonoides TaxID=34880 RepID=UPI002444A444|nr:uridine phosphorylase 2 isoform X2 [Nyctereutes procyonoides]